MEPSPKVLVKLLLPLTPLILKTALLSALSLSEGASKQETKTEVIVTVIRKIFNVRKPLTWSQKLSTRDPGIKGPLWISKATIPAPPEEDALDALLKAIKQLGDGTEDLTIPSIAPVEGEWTGYRSGVDKKAPRLDLSEAEQYNKLMSETSSPVTILYFHGGAYFLMDPASHRRATSALAKAVGGRCFSVRYRLAPQHPFPAQLLDAFIAYLYLLSPPADSFHSPIPASSIVFAGDSAGGNLSFALLLLILTLLKSGTTHILFHGKRVPLSLPASVTGNSPWLDISNSLPSVVTNAKYDYLQFSSSDTTTPGPGTPIPDPAWPTSPPRAEIFCSATLLTHPLVSPCLASAYQWRGAPPIFMCAGTECLVDSITHTARVMTRAGVETNLFIAEGMPHCFSMVFPGSAMGKECLRRWSGVMTGAVERRTAEQGGGGGEADDKSDKAGDSVRRQGEMVLMRAFKNPPVLETLTVDNVCDVDDEEVRAVIAKAKAADVVKEEEMVRKWKQGKEKEVEQEQTVGKAKL